MQIPFIKMHGAGNDFVVIDGRTLKIELSAKAIKGMADRQFGIGFDQLVVMEKDKDVDVFMRIYNADGGEVSTCGNATRCIAWLISEETGKKDITLKTKAGALSSKRAGDRQFTIDMGKPRLEWKEIPLSEERDTLHLGIQFGDYKDPVGVSMGNPHMIFFVKHVSEVPLGGEGVGTALEHHPLFPERANVNFAQVQNKGRILLRVWERGTGETLACGSGACATLVAAVRRGLTDRKATVALKGGDLVIEWLPDSQGGSVLMTGPVAEAFRGMVNLLDYQ